MLRGRSALARVCLCLVCLLGLPPAKPNDLSNQVRTLIDLASKHPALNEIGCRLYTPTTQDYLNCPSSTLKCFSEEVQVLIQEWKMADVTEIKSFGFKRGLGRLAKLNQTASDCLKCESLQEEEAVKFLKALEQTIQMTNM